MHGVRFIVAHVSRKERISLTLCQAINADRDAMCYVRYRNLPISPVHKAVMTSRHHLTSHHAGRCCKVTKKSVTPSPKNTAICVGHRVLLGGRLVAQCHACVRLSGDFMMMCYQLFYVGDEISEFKDK